MDGWMDGSVEVRVSPVAGWQRRGSGLVVVVVVVMVGRDAGKQSGKACEGAQ